jgi:hypothetical protein
LQPFPTDEVKQMLVLPCFEHYDFTEIEAAAMSADLAAMYRKVIAQSLYVGTGMPSPAEPPEVTFSSGWLNSPPSS